MPSMPGSAEAAGDDDPAQPHRLLLQVLLPSGSRSSPQRISTTTSLACARVVQGLHQQGRGGGRGRRVGWTVLAHQGDFHMPVGVFPPDGTNRAVHSRRSAWGVNLGQIPADTGVQSLLGHEAGGPRKGFGECVLNHAVRLHVAETGVDLPPISAVNGGVAAGRPEVRLDARPRSSLTEAGGLGLSVSPEPGTSTMKGTWMKSNVPPGAARARTWRIGPPERAGTRCRPRCRRFQ